MNMDGLPPRVPVLAPISHRHENPTGTQNMSSSTSSTPATTPPLMTMTSFTTSSSSKPRIAAYRIRPHQITEVHKTLQSILPELGYKNNEAARYISKSLVRDTQVLFVAQDCAVTPLPHEVVMLSMGKGSRVRVYHASRPVTEGVNWWEWIEASAEEFVLERIELPYTIFLDDIGWMLRAHAARARGLQEHVGDTHLIHRVERFFADLVFVVRRMVWAESNMAWKRALMR